MVFLIDLLLLALRRRALGLRLAGGLAVSRRGRNVGRGFIGLSFCFAPVQPPSACLESPIATAGSSAENIGVCPPK